MSPCKPNFMLSCFLLSDGDQEKTVSVLLDGKESVLSFLEPTEDQVTQFSGHETLKSNVKSMLIQRHDI